MRILKRLVAGILSVLLCLSFSSNAVFAEDKESISPKIRQELDVSNCKQGDVVTLAVYLQGNKEGWKLSAFKGVLEYDNSLFSLQKADILPIENEHVSEKSFNSSSCKFAVTYDSDITVSDKTAVLRLKLHVNEKATTGKTTLCVTNLEWKADGDAEKYEVEHRHPSSITISAVKKPGTEKPVAEKPELAGDVNLDGKVTLIDAKLIMQYFNKTKALNSKQKKNADINGDGKVNLADAKLIMKDYNKVFSQTTQTGVASKKSVTLTLTGEGWQRCSFSCKKGAEVKVKVKILSVSGKSVEKSVYFAGIYSEEEGFENALFPDVKTSKLKKNQTLTSYKFACRSGVIYFGLPKGMKNMKIKVTISSVEGKKVVKSLKKTK